MGGGGSTSIIANIQPAKANKKAKLSKSSLFSLDFNSLLTFFMKNNMPLTGDVRAASLDGDADRLVYFYVDSSGTFRLLDGDKIATLGWITMN